VSLFEPVGQQTVCTASRTPCRFGSDYTVTPTKDNDPLNGVSTFDLVLINKHILGLEPLNSAVQNDRRGRQQQPLDHDLRHRGTAQTDPGYLHRTAEQHVLAFCGQNYAFPNPSNPFQEIFPETKSVADKPVQFRQSFCRRLRGGESGRRKRRPTTLLCLPAKKR
jgi:hypothetical protein